MALTCPKCNAELSETEATCLRCGFSFTNGAGPADTLTQNVEQLLISGQKIAAIKAHREATGSELVDSKRTVEQIEQRLIAEGRVRQKSGCLAVLIGFGMIP